MKQISQRLIRACFFCHKKTGEFLLCEDCRTDPFAVERAKMLAAKNKNIKVFKQLYSGKYTSIKNLNTKNFWNAHFLKELSLEDQDAMTKEKLKLLVSLFPSHSVKILDLGFGQGYLEELLCLSRNDDLFGIDISSSAIKKAERKFNGNFVKEDVLKVKNTFSNEKFDVIVAIELIEHITPQRTLGFLTDVYTLLKPGGIFLISTPTNEHLEKMRDNPSGHVRTYTPGVLSMELEVSGFKVEKVKMLYAFRTHYKLKKFLAKIFRNHWEANNIVVKAVKI